MSKKPIKSNPFLSKEYKTLLKEIKDKILSSQLKAAVAVNSELIKLYWEIGNVVCKQLQQEVWGSKAVEKLAKDLKSSFPDMKGFSLRNIRYMAAFAKEYPDLAIVQQGCTNSVGHNMLLLDRLNSQKERICYIQQTIENGWSSSVLLHWIDSNLYKRQAKTITNFKATLAPIQSDLAQQTLKDPYCFDFLTLRKEFDEKELEQGLLDHIQKFLLEFGAGFSFVGRQIKLEVGEQDFYVDLLFYHLKLRSFVVK